WIRADRRGQGLCNEAVSHLLSWALTPANQGGWGIRRIEIHCAAKNAASVAVARRLALRQEMQLRHARWVPGIGWDDSLGWGALAEEWDTSRHQIRERR